MWRLVPPCGVAAQTPERMVMRVPVRILTAVALASSAVAVTACGDEGSGGGADSVDVAFVYAQKGDAFQEAMACGAKLKARALGVNLEIQAPARFSPPLQIQVLNGVAAQQPDALIVAPQDSRALYQPTKAIADAGAKIVDIDEAFVDQDIVDSLVLADNAGGGRDGAEAMAELIGESGKVLPIDLAPGLPGVNARATGFEEGIARYAGIELLPTRYDRLDPARAAAIVKATLASNPDLRGIYTTTGFGAEGAVTALKEQGLIGDVKIVTFDTLPPAVESLEQGEVQAAISQRGLDEGAAAVAQAVAAVRGDPVESKIDVETITITQDNMDDPDVRKYLYEEQVKQCG
jgi:ribose transport system substrate-binding protein